MCNVEGEGWDMEFDQMPVPSSPVTSWTTLSSTSEMTRGCCSPFELDLSSEPELPDSRLCDRSAPIDMRNVPFCRFG
jgi:hypothetical protein